MMVLKFWFYDDDDDDDDDDVNFHQRKPSFPSTLAELPINHYGENRQSSRTRRREIGYHV